MLSGLLSAAEIDKVVIFNSVGHHKMHPAIKHEIVRLKYFITLGGNIIVFVILIYLHEGVHTQLLCR